MTSEISDGAVAVYLDRVRTSRVLGRSKRRMRLLEYLITAEVSGDGDNIKAYAIGLDVFDKPDDFDPSIDSIVRVEIGRLRAALAKFEASKFADTPIVVDIPVGTYRPSLQIRDAKPVQTPQPRRTRRRLTVALTAAAAWLTVMGAWIVLHGRDHVAAPDYTMKVELQPFQGDADIAAQVGAALRRGLVRTKSLTVLTPRTDGNRSNADFVLRGLINGAGDGTYRVDAELINTGTNAVVWARSHVFDDTPEIEARVMTVLSNDLRVRLFSASKEVLEGRDPRTLTPEQLFVMATWVPGRAMNAVSWEQERINLARLALEKDPDFGGAHSVLADKLAYLANVYGPADTPQLRAEAEVHAQRALELDAQNPDVVFNVAQSQWHLGQIAESHILMQRVLELDPGHDLARFLELVIPYTCAVPPGNVLRQAIDFDAALAADNPIRWLTLSWVAWLHAHRGDHEVALNIERRAATIFEIPYTFMRHAMLLNRLGEIEAATAVIDRQSTNWPDISADHFADVTVPRLCQESPMAGRFVEEYRALADTIAVMRPAVDQ